jgi:2-keto-3-deoxy-L-rhamnonate aldolase RhmA
MFLAERLAAARGKPLWGTFLLELQSTAAVHVLANANLDFFMIDDEHGTFSVERIAHLIEMGNAMKLCPMVRVSDLCRGTITKALDAGAAGIVVPQVCTMDEVRDAVRFSKYPPLGRRGVHRIRAHTKFSPPADLDNFLGRANRDVITAIQIETRDAVALIDQIAATEGVDMLYVGPGDLSVDLHCTGQNHHLHPIIEGVLLKVAAACKKHGKLAGAHLLSLDYAEQVMSMGFALLGYGTDITFIADGLARFHARVNALAPDGERVLAARVTVSTDGRRRGRANAAVRPVAK